MKTGEAAKLLGVDPQTVRNWIDHSGLNQFFSDGARGEHGEPHRVLNESDILVLNTVRHIRASGPAEWDEVINVLESGRRIQEFPQNAISGDPRVIPLPQAEQAAKYLATVAERDSALARVDELESEIERLRQKLDETQDAWRKDRNDLHASHQKEVAEREREIGRLQMQVEMLQKQLEYSQKPVDGKREGDE